MRRENTTKIILKFSVMKCMEISLENLYVDLGTKRVKETFSSFLLKMRVSAQSSFDCTCGGGTQCFMWGGSALWSNP